MCIPSWAGLGKNVRRWLIWNRAVRSGMAARSSVELRYLRLFLLWRTRGWVSTLAEKWAGFALWKVEYVIV